MVTEKPDGKDPVRVIERAEPDGKIIDDFTVEYAEKRRMPGEFIVNADDFMVVNDVKSGEERAGKTCKPEPQKEEEQQHAGGRSEEGAGPAH